MLYQHYYHSIQHLVNKYSLICELIETHGTRNTRWERLYDDNTDSYYMLNVGSQASLDEVRGGSTFFVFDCHI